MSVTRHVYIFFAKFLLLLLSFPIRKTSIIERIDISNKTFAKILYTFVVCCSKLIDK